MIIKNVNILNSDKTFTFGSVFTENRLFSDKSDDDIIIDGNGLYAVPGLVDIHFHGCSGFDFCDGTTHSIEEIAEYQAKNGITSICPATMSLPQDDLISILSVASEFMAEDNMAGLIGINLEGPYINQNKCGAHNPKHIRSYNKSEFERFYSASKNLIKLVTIAPETENSFDFIKEYSDKLTVSLGHTSADYTTSKKAFDMGATHVTHLFNAMSPFTHREPSLIGAAFESDCYAELICDGVHLHNTAINMAYKLLTDEKIVLISDSMRATGLNDGEYTLGGQIVEVKDKTAKIKSSSAIAGSVYNLADCVRFVINNTNISFESAIKCATVNPAKAIGCFDKIGSIEKGKIANLLLVDKVFNIKAVVLRGQLLSNSME